MKFASHLILALAIFNSSSSAGACTVFFSGARGTPAAQLSHQALLAKNFDWSDGEGYLLFSPAKEIRRTERGQSWQAQYSSLSFHLSSVGPRLPMGGVNERGLSIEAVWLANAQYPAPRSGNPVVNELEFIRYILDNAANTAEAQNLAVRFAITEKFEPLHFMVCDPQGCLVLEFIQGRLWIYTGRTLPAAVLTNTPYESSLRQLSMFVGFGGQKPIEGHGPSVRFARSTLFLMKTPKPTVAALFEALEASAIPSGSFATQWSYILDLNTQTVMIRTADPSPPLRIADLNQLKQQFKKTTVVYRLKSSH